MKKGITGWKDVYSFTFMQNVKEKTFKLALYGIAILIFAIFLAINIIVAVVNDDDDNEVELITKSNVDIIHIVNNSDIENVDFQELTQDDKNFSNISLIMETNEKSPIKLLETIDLDSREIVLCIQKYIYNTVTDEYTLLEEYKPEIKEDESTDNDSVDIVYGMIIYGKENGVLDNDEERDKVYQTVEHLANYFETAKYNFIGVNSEGMEVLNSELFVETTDVKELDKSLTEILAKLFIPMIVCLLVYMLVLLYGQSISKILIVEKSSKLMEMLLTSIQPYAIILGKILAIFSVALIQIFVWIGSGFLGYFIGDKVASSMFSGYENPVYMIIDIFKYDSASAFTLPAIIMGLLVLIFGFFMYCVMAGLFSAGATKAEDLSNHYAIFQVIVVIGFLGAYMLPIVSDNLVHAIRFIPVTAPFLLPADVILGSSSIASSLISLGIMLVTSIVMVFFAGKIYKKKIF